MSSIPIAAASSTYGGRNPRETLAKMAAATDCRCIYAYRNAYQPWWRLALTDYYRIEKPGDEERLRSSPHVRDAVLVYDHGEIRLPLAWAPYAAFVLWLASVVLSWPALLALLADRPRPPMAALIPGVLGLQVSLALAAILPAWLLWRFALRRRPGAGLLAGSIVMLAAVLWIWRS